MLNSKKKYKKLTIKKTNEFLNDWLWVKKVINSCTKPIHLISCIKLYENLCAKYKGYITSLDLIKAVNTEYRYLIRQVAHSLTYDTTAI